MNNNRLMALILSLVMLMTVAAPSAALADEGAGGGAGIEVVTPAGTQPAQEKKEETKAVPKDAGDTLADPPAPETFTVKFFVEGSQVGDTQIVEKGKDATPPSDVKKADDDDNYYDFKEWDPSYENIQVDTECHAVFTTVAKHYVTFMDGYAEKQIGDPVPVRHGGTVKIPDNMPDHEDVGYKFDKWDKSLKDITGDVTITASYIVMTFTVTFQVKLNGTPEQTFGPSASVNYGEAYKQALPELPKIDGYTFSGIWQNQNKLASVTADVVVYALYLENTRVKAELDSSYVPALKTYKPKDTFGFALPAICTVYSKEFQTNVDQNGNYVSDYEDSFAEDYELFDVANIRSQDDSKPGIKSMKIVADLSALGSVLKAKSTSADIVVESFENPETNQTAPRNYGFGVFADSNFQVASGAKNGSYVIPLQLVWTDFDNKSHKVDGIEVPFKVTGGKSSSSSSSGSGGGGGGSSGESTPLPDTRLYIKDVSTDPAHPKAGDEFTIRMELVNTNAKRYLHNMQISWTAADDVLVPWGTETNVKYIEKIDKSGTYIWEFKVKSLPELASKQVKLDIAMECQDSKMTAISETQTVNVEVLPLQRIKIDELKLPTGSTIAGDDYSISVVVANAGKTILNNLNARIVTDNPDLVPGSSFYGGNLESGQSKTIELDCTPIEAGAYDAYVEITYEDENGNVTADSTSKKEFSLAAVPAEDEDMGWMEETDSVDIQPQQPAVTARSIMAMLPAWLYAALGALLLLLIVSMSVSARKRRRRAMEDDEME